LNVAVLWQKSQSRGRYAAVMNCPWWTSAWQSPQRVESGL
jgi:hypothetical protein